MHDDEQPPAPESTARRVTRSSAFRRTSPESTPRVIRRGKRRLREKWSSEPLDYAWEDLQLPSDSSSVVTDELHHVILGSDQSLYDPVFEPGSATVGQNLTFNYSPGPALGQISDSILRHVTPERRFSFSGVRRVSTSDIQQLCARLLFPSSSAPRTNVPGVSGVFSELARDSITRPIRARNLALEYVEEVETPTMEERCRTQRCQVREAVNAASEFETFELEGVPEGYIRAAITDATRYRKILLENTAFLEDSDNTYGPPLSEQATAARKIYNTFCVTANKKIFEIETHIAREKADQEKIGWERAAATAAAAKAAAPPPPEQSAAVRFKASKVKDYEAETLATIAALCGEFDGLGRNQPTSEKEAKLAEERLSTLSKRAENAVREGRALSSDAAECGMLLSAETIEKEVRKLNQARDETASQLSESKLDLGVIGSGSSVRNEDLEPPKFNGDLEHMDYYTWAKDLEDYFEAKNLNKAQQVAVVKKSCLQGVPATACAEMTELPEMLKFLKNYYGNAGLMLDAKIRDFRKLGKCGGGATKTRDWIIRARQKLDYLHKLALQHNIQNHLYYSTLMSEVHQSLTHDARKGFREKMDDIGAPVFNKEELFKHTLEFLEELEQKSNFQVNFEITMGAPKADDKVAKPASSGKKSYNMKVVQLDSSEDETDDSVDEIDHIQVAYSPPQDRNCKLCNTKHDYLFYCEKFQTTRTKDRFRLTRSTRVCMRCLRMDSKVDFNDRQAWFQEHADQCETEWQCIEADCAKKDKEKQFHFLMCNRHIAANKNRVDAFKKKLDKAQVKSTTKFLFNTPLQVYRMEDIALPQVSRHPPGFEVEPDIIEPAIFLMQNYETKEGKKILIMFDSGCSAAALTEAAASYLETEVIRPGPTQMGVAGGRTILIEGGDVRFGLETPKTNHIVSITGLVMPTITTPFPVYPLSEAYEDLKKSYSVDHPQSKSFPTVPNNIGGSSVGIMMGIRYVRYFPKLLYSLNCGLGIYEAQFRTPDGNLGILGGPHKSWREVYSSQVMSPVIFLTNEMKAYRQEGITMRHLYKDIQHLDMIETSDAFFENCGAPYLDTNETSADFRKNCGAPSCGDDTWSRDLTSSQASPAEEKVVPGRGNTCSVPACNFSETVTELDSEKENSCGSVRENSCVNKHCKKHVFESGFTVPAHWDLSDQLFTARGDLEKYLELENCGSELTYRCIKCRNCVDCRNADNLEKTSLQDEKQQALLESCVYLDKAAKALYATLPFIADPSKNLKPNRHLAEKILNSQLRRLEGRPEAVQDVLRAHNKLRDKGYVVPVNDLPKEAQRAMAECGYESTFLPWSTVSKEASISTPTRQVFNASSRTPGGLSLNQILAKGQNSLPKIFQIITAFRSKKHGFVCDISMAYNSVRLDPNYYAFQKYLWKEECDSSNELMVFVIVTLIYGVICSGGMTTAGICKTADHTIENYPEHAQGAAVLKTAIYVDDVAQPTDTEEESRRLAESVMFTLAQASMKVKDFTFVGSPPSDKVSADGSSIGLLGYTWWPVEDKVGIAIKPLFFGKMKRGKTPGPVVGDVQQALRQNFDRRTLTGKAAEVFDPIGLTTPITARFKMNLSEIVSLKLGWDDPIPEKFLDVWTNNLDDMQRIKTIRFPRSFIHPDAVSNRVELIISVDASKDIAVAAAHARSELPDGSFDCRLIAAKSKLVSLSTIPRAELRGAVLGSTMAHIIKRTLGDRCTSTIYVTDSTVVLFWLNQDQRPLQTAVRNGVIEVRRLTNLEDWHHVASADNVADVGTRHVEVSEIGEDSVWARGHPWMSLPREEMPLKTVDEVLLNQQERQAAQREIKAVDICGIAVQSLTGKLAERYSYSKYVVDPCIMQWPKSVRVLAFVMKFVKLLKAKVAAKRPHPPAEDEEGSPPPAEDGNLDIPARVSTINVFSEPSSIIGGSGLPTLNSEKVPKISIGGSEVPISIPGPEVPHGISKPTRFFQMKNLEPTLAGKIQDWQLETSEIEKAEAYFFRKGTREMKHFSKQADYKDCSVLKDGILRYSSRILDGHEIDDVENIMDDLAPLTFCNPMLDRWSPVAYSIMVYSHQMAARHRNAVATLLESRKIAFILKGRDLANEIRNCCIFCRRFKAKLVEVEMGKVHSSRLTIAAAFFRVQVDLFGPLTARCNHNHRSSVPVWGCIFKDPASGAISVHAMEKYDTGAFLAAYTRHSCRYGHPARIYIDGGSQLVKGCRDMELNWAELTTTLNSKFSVGIEYEVCAVGRHDRHGAVERAVQSVKKIFYQVFKGLKMDLFAYETAFCFVANELNSLPICLGSKSEGLEHTDLITANRLILGRNNKRAPLGYPRIQSASRQVEQMDQLHKAWWNVWRNERIVDHIPKPSKWTANSRAPEMEDIVVFLKHDKEATLGDTLWKLGRIVEVVGSEGDGKVRSVRIEYKNPNEEVFRTTYRSVRKIAILFKEGDIELTDVLNEAARSGDQLFIQHMRRAGGPPPGYTLGAPEHL